MTGDTNRQEDPESDAPLESANSWHRLVEVSRRPLPLQHETSMFILVNVLDLFVTYILLAIGGSEANPIARVFLVRWGFAGMIAFKMTIIAFFCVVTLLISQVNLAKAERLMRIGTIVVVLVVLYGIALIYTQIF